MKKNLIIILLIFIIPVVAYTLLSKNNTVSAQKVIKGQPQIIKFSSKLCLDCKKIKKVFDEIKPQYQDKITIIEYDVQMNDNRTKEAIDKYDISLVPTIIFIDKTGEETKRTEGFVDIKELEQYFKELLE